MNQKKKNSIKSFMLACLITVASFAGAYTGAVVKTNTKLVYNTNSTMVVTAYAELSDTVALGYKAKPGLHAAVSKDRLDLLGKRVYVSCGNRSLGVREVVDVTSNELSNTLDLLVPTTELAKKFGKCADCTVQVIN